MAAATRAKPAAGLGNPFVKLSLPVVWGDSPPVAALTVPTATAAATATSGPAAAAAAPATVPDASNKAPAFFDNLHGEVIVLRATKILVSTRTAPNANLNPSTGGGGGGWTEYPLRVPITEVVDAKLSPNRSLLALRIANREVKVVDTRTGDVVTARSCRGTSARMLAVHWLNTDAFLLFVTNAGVELYGLGGSKLKHVKTVPFQLMHHWFLVDENALLLVDHTRNFQCYRLSPKTITKLCKFHPETVSKEIGGKLAEHEKLLLTGSTTAAAATASAAAPAAAASASGAAAAAGATNTTAVATTKVPTVEEENLEFVQQISLISLYRKIVIAYANGKQNLLHLIGVGSSTSQPEQKEEHLHVSRLPTQGRYIISVLDDVVIAHHLKSRTAILIDIAPRIVEQQQRAAAALAAQASTPTGLGVSGVPLSSSPSTPMAATGVSPPTFNHSGAGGAVPNYTGNNNAPAFAFAVAAAAPANTTASVVPTPLPINTHLDNLASAAIELTLPVGGYAIGTAKSLNRIFTDENLRFVSPMYILDAPKETTRRVLYSLELDLEAIAAGWPIAKRIKLIDFLLRRASGAAAKRLILQTIYELICARTSLGILSRVFLTLNRVCYDIEFDRAAAAARAPIAAAVPLTVVPGGTIAGVSSLMIAGRPSTSGVAPPSAAHRKTSSSSAVLYNHTSLSSLKALSATTLPTSPENGFAASIRSAPTSPLQPTNSQRPNTLPAPLNSSAVPTTLTQSAATSAATSPVAPNRASLSNAASPNPTRGSIAGAPVTAGTGTMSTARMSVLHVTSPGPAAGTVSAMGSPSGLAPVLEAKDEKSSVAAVAATDPDVVVDNEESLASAEAHASLLSIIRNSSGLLLISQSEMFEFVFVPARRVVPAGVLIPYLNEYLRTVYRHFLKTEEGLNHLLVGLLIADARYFELHQYLQYHIIADSVPIAERLLELGGAYPAAYQLGLDMLYRLSAFGILMRVLLNRRQVIAALRLATPRSPLFDGSHPALLPSEFLRVAKESGDPNVFYAAYKFFESRNVLVRGHPAFTAADNCQLYTAHYMMLFANPDASPLMTPFALSLNTSATQRSAATAGTAPAPIAQTVATK